MNGLGPQPGRQSSWKAGLEDLGFCQSLSCEDFNELYVNLIQVTSSNPSVKHSIFS